MKAPPSFVIDNSVVVAWCFKDEQTKYAIDVIERLRKLDAAAPVIWPLEFTNALLSAERRGRLKRGDVDRLISLVAELPIVVDHAAADEFTSLAPLARDYGLSTYDASYLELAIRRDIPLATLDAALKRAANRAGVAVFKP